MFDGQLSDKKEPSPLFEKRTVPGVRCLRSLKNRVNRAKNQIKIVFFSKTFGTYQINPYLCPETTKDRSYDDPKDHH